jgi:hypothetical protein
LRCIDHPFLLVRGFSRSCVSFGSNRIGRGMPMAPAEPLVLFFRGEMILLFDAVATGVSALDRADSSTINLSLFPSAWSKLVDRASRKGSRGRRRPPTERGRRARRGKLRGFRIGKVDIFVGYPLGTQREDRSVQSGRGTKKQTELLFSFRLKFCFGLILCSKRAFRRSSGRSIRPWRPRETLLFSRARRRNSAIASSLPRIGARRWWRWREPDAAVLPLQFSFNSVGGTKLQGTPLSRTRGRARAAVKASTSLLLLLEEGIATGVSALHFGRNVRD